MSLQYCEDCDKNIDLDEDVEHFEQHKIEDAQIEEDGK